MDAKQVQAEIIKTWESLVAARQLLKKVEADFDASPEYAHYKEAILDSATRPTARAELEETAISRQRAAARTEVDWLEKKYSGLKANVHKVAITAPIYTEQQ